MYKPAKLTRTEVRIKDLAPGTLFAWYYQRDHTQKPVFGMVVTLPYNILGKSVLLGACFKDGCYLQDNQYVVPLQEGDEVTLVAHTKSW